jgi:DNA polymerase III alpha subunit (gram-positive type)
MNSCDWFVESIVRISYMFALEHPFQYLIISKNFLNDIT